MGALYIGLVGFKQSGKSTTCNIIKEWVPSARELMIAGKLKEACSVVFDLEFAQFEDQALKEVPFPTPIDLTPERLRAIAAEFAVSAPEGLIAKIAGAKLISPRHIAQFVGTEFIREIDPDAHVKWVAHRANPEGINVITDIRFWNEFNYFKALNFVPIFISRKAAAKGVDLAQAHSSEKYVPEIGAKCIPAPNNGSVDDLRRILGEIFDYVVSDDVRRYISNLPR
jgi:hypothetical protein